MSLRNTKSAEGTKTKALPAAAASNNSDAIFLGTGIEIERFEVRVSLPALASLVDAKTVTCTLQDSADGSSFAAIPELATLVVTGAGGVGAAAAVREVRLPSSFRGYIRVNTAVLTAGGDNTAASVTLEVLS